MSALPSNEPAEPAAAPPPEPAPLAGELPGRLAAMQARLDGLDAAVEGVARQLSFLPAQVRLLSGKVDGLSTAISEARYRAVLLSLLNVYDLVDQTLRTLPPPEADREAEHRRNYEVVRTQLRQILEVNGLFEVAAAGPFNPEVHRAVQRVPCADPAQDNLIVQVVRPGFRTEHAILRYAEVCVSRYQPPAVEAA